MEDFYTLKDEVLSTIENIPKFHLYPHDSTVCHRNPKECAEYLPHCISLWNRIQSNSNLTSSMKASLFEQFYHTISTCHTEFCYLCKTMNHTDRQTYILNLMDTSPKSILEPCTSK